MDFIQPIQRVNLGDLPEEFQWPNTVPFVEAKTLARSEKIPLVVVLGYDGINQLLSSITKDVTIDLIISLDVNVWDEPRIMSRCRDVLTAPFEHEWLVEKLDNVSAEQFTEVSLIVEEQLVGQSPLMRLVHRDIRSIANFNAPLLIKGETGTGKELVARAVHYCSNNRDMPFIPINCGGFTDDLFLAELFGYEKGAFTDAKSSHAGLVEQAEGGTLFLDEIDSLSLRSQVALLRFLQEFEYRRVGGKDIKKANIRVVSATNRCLETLVAKEVFREDLFFRLDIVDIELPPLRTRAGDIEVLSRLFLDKLATQYHQPKRSLHEDTLLWMKTYSWPGNVRELENYLHRIFVLSADTCIRIPEVKGRPNRNKQASSVTNQAPIVELFSIEKTKAVEKFERDYLERIMSTNEGNITRAAEQAGKERRTFGRLLKKYGIDRSQFVR